MGFDTVHEPENSLKAYVTITCIESLAHTDAEIVLSTGNQNSTSCACSGEEVESVVYRKKSLRGVATPGVLFMHGGPHAAVQDAFVGPMLALVAEGYTVVLPNYRGSAGYGDGHLERLPGHAGMVCTPCCLSVSLPVWVSFMYAYVHARTVNSE